MARPFREYLDSLPPDRRAAIEARAAESIAEEYTLREAREALAKSQAEVAAALGIEQAAVSKLERRGDMHVSTLRALVKAMGGTVYIMAAFPGREPIRINQFDGEAIPPAEKGRKKESGVMVSDQIVAELAEAGVLERSMPKPPKETKAPRPKRS